MDKNYNTNDLLTENNPNNEISCTISESNIGYETCYTDSKVNFFGISSGITYTNLDINTFNEY